VTDLAGEDWTPTSRSALAGVPSVHEQILELVLAVGAPGEY